MSNQHGTHIETQSGQKTLSSYVIGIVLCLILTFLSFGIVEKPILSTSATYISLAVLAVIQLIVQAICFLRLNTSAEGRWNLFPFLFTILIMGILVAGSLWIMYNLDYFMYN